MTRKQQIFNYILVLFLCNINIILASRDNYKEYTLGYPKLCSFMVTRKVKYEALVVHAGQFINQHSHTWNIDHTCRFEVHSAYSGGGIIAVIQNMNLRKNESTQECIDYIEITVRSWSTVKFCGNYDAHSNMSKFDSGYSSENSIHSSGGMLEVTIFIDKKPLTFDERTEFNVTFTSYKDCSEKYKNKQIYFNSCFTDEHMCINSKYFDDGYINCPYYNCVDEDGCSLNVNTASHKGSMGDKALLGSLSILAMLFTLFVIILWAFKKHKLFCWADTFAHPATAVESNRNSHVMEMNVQTGARLADASTHVPPPSAPVDVEKDLPPSYESLFSNTQ